MRKLWVIVLMRFNQGWRESLGRKGTSQHARKSIMVMPHATRMNTKSPPDESIHSTDPQLNLDFLNNELTVAGWRKAQS
jgi:hypothetical protein